MNLIDELEKLGEREVRKRLASNVYGDSRNPNNESVQTWLRSKEAEGAKSREEKTLSIAQEANLLAQEANKIARDEAASAARSARWAKIAAIIAAIAAIISSATTIIMALLTNN